MWWVLRVLRLFANSGSLQRQIATVIWTYYCSSDYTTQVHLFSQAACLFQLLLSLLLCLVNHSPVSFMSCSAKVCCYSVCQEGPLCPCCQIRPVIWPRAPSLVLMCSQAEKSGSVSISPNITALQCVYLKRCLPRGLVEDTYSTNQIDKCRVLKYCFRT